MAKPHAKSGSNPISVLTPAEILRVEWLELTSNREQVLSWLKQDLQTAVEIELATIPIYLYTYYSLVRNNTSGENLDAVQQFVNKAGGMIMSVAVEEMLHMSLSANIYFALCGTAPQIYKKSPGPYPTGLPYHSPEGPPGPEAGSHRSSPVSIPLARFSYEQLWHFLQIEYPEAVDAWPEDRNWNTIGQFYSNIRCLISTQFVTDADFQNGAKASQIQSYNYSPNNVDTVYPSAPFNAWIPAPPANASWAPANGLSGARSAVYPDAPDSHAGPVELLSVDSKNAALEAIDTISDQGEGYARPWQGEEPTDDPSKREDSHYYKFLSLQAQLVQYPQHREKLAAAPVPPGQIPPVFGPDALSGLVVDFPNSPRTAYYPVELQPLSDFCNGLFQYMLIMTETVYRVPPAGQKLFFNVGLHRSMIWVLDKYLRNMREMQIRSGLYQGRYFAPTFECVDLGPPETSFSALATLGETAVAAANNIIDNLPGDDPWVSPLGNLIYYIGVATTKTVDGHSMHLPDVGPYWKQG